MKYIRCPVCQLNYVTVEQSICNVCRDRLTHKSTEEEEDFEICPICYKSRIGKDDLMCKRCFQKRNKKPIEDISAFSDEKEAD